MIMTGMLGAIVLTGGALFDNCNAKGARRVSCEAYVRGVVDATVTIGQSAGETLLCVPEAIPDSRIADTVSRYIASVPDKRHMTASSLTLYALQLTYPCPD